MSDRAKARGVKEAAEILNISARQAYRLVYADKLKHVRAGRKILIPDWALDEFLGKPKD